MSLASVGYREVESIVQTWTKKYQYHISLLDSRPNEVKFMVEFSLPQAQQPVPVATIRVYFTCTSQDQLSITFRFEKDCLIHSPGKTIRQQQIQKWIDDSLSKKLLVRETVFYMGTAYERSRVKNERQDKIMYEEVKPEEVEDVWIHPDLLADQKRFIEIMEKSEPDTKTINEQLKKSFKEVDPENIGVVTYPEFLSLIKSVGIKLSGLEEKQILKRLDPEETGMIEYQNYQAISRQFFEGLEAKKAADARLQLNYEEEVFGSILSLISDEAQDIEDMIVERFRIKDEDQTGMTNISDVKAVLDEINKKFKDEGKAQPLSVVELADITKVITDAHGYKQIPYTEIHKHIIQYKVKQLSTGRVSSRVNNIEAHLQQIFTKHDEKKNGKIKMESLEEALRRSEKIKLSKSQFYLLKSLLWEDGKGDVNYADNSKFLAELIKRLYLCSSKKRKE